MIEFRTAEKAFLSPTGPSVHALKGLDLVIPTGEIHCLLGTSGSGKSTALKLVNRLLEPTSGTVRVDGADVRQLDPIRLRRGIGYVLQEGGLFPHMSVSRNVGLLSHLEGWSAERTRARVEELLTLVNLEPATYGTRYPAELSGGQRQRVGVARALALDPPHLLMDEPFGALDPITRRELQGEFADLFQRMRKTVLFVSHDVEEAFRLADRVSLLHAGELVQSGTADELENSPATPFVADFLRGVAR